MYPHISLVHHSSLRDRNHLEEWSVCAHLVLKPIVSSFVVREIYLLRIAMCQNSQLRLPQYAPIEVPDSLNTNLFGAISHHAFALLRVLQMQDRSYSL